MPDIDGVPVPGVVLLLYRQITFGDVASIDTCICTRGVVNRGKHAFSKHDGIVTWSAHGYTAWLTRAPTFASRDSNHRLASTTITRPTSEECRRHIWHAI